MISVEGGFSGGAPLTVVCNKESVMGSILRLLGTYSSDLLDGLRLTLEVFSLSALLAVLVGVVVPTIMSFRVKIVNVILGAYISVFRHAPLLAHLFFFFYGLPLMGIFIPSFWVGVICIMLNEGAFISEILRGSISNVAREDLEAAESLGLTKFQILRYVVLPQAIRDAIPAITGQVSIIMKDTSLLALVLLPELTYRANRIYMKTFNSNSLYIAACIYILIFIIVNFISKFIEGRVRVRR